MARNKPCNPASGQAEYERCLDEKRERRAGRGDSRLTQALDETDRDEDLEIEDD